MSATRSAVLAVSLPAIVGGVLGAVAALVLPNGDQGDVLTATPVSLHS